MEARAAAWATEQRTLHGLQSSDTRKFTDKISTFGELNLMAEETKRRAEIARLVFMLENNLNCRYILVI